MSDTQENESMDLSASSTSSSPRTPPNCARCRNHGHKIALKAHKRYCQYRSCKCDRCKLTSERQRIMAQQTAQRRAQAQDEAMIKHMHPRAGVLKHFNKSTSSHCSPTEGVLRKLSTEEPVQTTVVNVIPSSQALVEDCQRLLERFKYPWEMMPLMYAILKGARADPEEASRRIDEDTIKQQDRRTPFQLNTTAYSAATLNVQFKCNLVI